MASPFLPPPCRRMGGARWIYHIYRDAYPLAESGRQQRSMSRWETAPWSFFFLYCFFMGGAHGACSSSARLAPWSFFFLSFCHLILILPSVLQVGSVFYVIITGISRRVKLSQPLHRERNVTTSSSGKSLHSLVLSLVHSSHIFRLGARMLQASRCTSVYVMYSLYQIRPTMAV